MKKNSKFPNSHPVLQDPFNPKSIIITDPLGSYTGRPLDGEEVPVQDADDL